MQWFSSQRERMRSWQWPPYFGKDRHSAKWNLSLVFVCFRNPALDLRTRLLSLKAGTTLGMPLVWVLQRLLRCTLLLCLTSWLHNGPRGISILRWARPYGFVPILSFLNLLFFPCWVPFFLLFCCDFLWYFPHCFPSYFFVHFSMLFLFFRFFFFKYCAFSFLPSLQYQSGKRSRNFAAPQ